MILRALAAVGLMALSSAAVAEDVASASGGEIRVLDKITGRVVDLDMKVGETQKIGLIAITMGDCRYPVNNPSGDAYVELTVLYQENPEPVFAGWMLASAPALNAMDHPRYDVWALRCTTS